MALFQRKLRDGGFRDEIRCDETFYLIWKWRPQGVDLGEKYRENAIRNGSSLRVKDGEVAVFVYKQKDGTMQDYIVGPHDEKIKTKNFPVLSRLVGLAFEGGTPFQAEIYFINLSHVLQVKFAVPFFDIFDGRFPDFGVPTAVRGTITFKIQDYQQFIKVHRLIDFQLPAFQTQIRDAVIKQIKSIVANVPHENNIPLIQIERKTAEISDFAEKKLAERLRQDFGVCLTGLDIANIEIDKTSEGYRQLMAITKDITTATIQAQTAANLEHYTESLRIQREEGQYATHKATQTANLGAFQTEKQAEVGVAAANALGKMGSNGAGDVNISGGVGFNPVAMMAGMTLGGAVGKNIAGIMNESISNGQTPPPPPTNVYFVALNRQATGPFDYATLSQMALTGSLTKDSLVWKQGMPAWARADNIQELQALFNLPPIPPMQ